MNESEDNIIHVNFVTGTRKKTEPLEVPPAIPPAEVLSVEPEPSRDTREDPLAALYSASDVVRLFSLQESRLRYWDRSGFLSPSGQAGRRRYYTFQDLIGIRAAKAMLDRGVHFRTVRRSVEALRASLPKVVRPLSELRVVADGQSIVVKSDEGAFEPTTGQLVLDFDVSELREDVVRVLRPASRSDNQRRAAYEFYLEGCRLDEDPATFERAEEAYRQALELDPTLANAITNLGNLRFKQGHPDEAEAFYRKALSIDFAQPEAHYNLGFMYYERSELGLAVESFRRALDHDASFADAHFNLAMALEELGRAQDALSHWEMYVKLDPSGPWSEIARRHLTLSPRRG